MRIKITTDDGDEKVIDTGGDVENPESIIQAHGIDPNAVSYSTQETSEKRIEKLEAATGVDEVGQTGIPQRLDDIESRLDDLEASTNS